MKANPVLVPTGRQRRASSTAVLARGTTPRYGAETNNRDNQPDFYEPLGKALPIAHFTPSP